MCFGCVCAHHHLVCGVLSVEVGAYAVYHGLLSAAAAVVVVVPYPPSPFPPLLLLALPLFLSHRCLAVHAPCCSWRSRSFSI